MSISKFLGFWICTTWHVLYKQTFPFTHLFMCSSQNIFTVQTDQQGIIVTIANQNQNVLQTSVYHRDSESQSILYILSFEMCLSISKNEVNINVLHTAFRKSFTVCRCIRRFLTDQINSKVYLRQNPCRVKSIRSNTCIMFNSLNNTLSCKILYYNMYIV